MASSSQNNLDEAFDDAFDEVFDQHFDEAFESFTLHGDQEERRKKKEKNGLISKDIGNKDTISYGTIISMIILHTHRKCLGGVFE